MKRSFLHTGNRYSSFFKRNRCPDYSRELCGMIQVQRLLGYRNSPLSLMTLVLNVDKNIYLSEVNIAGHSHDTKSSKRVQYIMLLRECYTLIVQS